MYNEPSSMFCLFQEDLVSPISLKDEVKFVWNQTSWSEGYSFYKNGGYEWKSGGSLKDRGDKHPLQTMNKFSIKTILALIWIGLKFIIALRFKWLT